MIELHSWELPSGRTQALTVTAALGDCSEVELATVTRLLVPLKERALLNLPPVVHVAPEMAPVFAFPEASATVPPVPSFKPYAAAKFGVGTCAIARVG